MPAAVPSAVSARIGRRRMARIAVPVGAAVRFPLRAVRGEVQQAIDEKPRQRE